MPATVRPATPDDFTAIAALCTAWQRHWAHRRRTHWTPDTQARVQATQTVLVYHDGAAVRAAILLFPPARTRPRHVYIDAIPIDETLTPEAQRTAATDLIRAALAAYPQAATAEGHVQATSPLAAILAHLPITTTTHGRDPTTGAPQTLRLHAHLETLRRTLPLP